jgi:hypothetical protein
MTPATIPPSSPPLAITYLPMGIHFLMRPQLLTRTRSFPVGGSLLKHS